MPIRAFSIESFRNIEAADLVFSPHINLITGANAAGKTSLLEAIHCLARTRSFRTNQLSRLVRQGESGFKLLADVELDNGTRLPVGVGFGSSRFEIRMNRQPVRRLSELASIFPMQVLAGNIHQLIEEGPRYRRRYLDWGLFHVEPTYAEVWRRYHRVLKQRNAALRHRVPDAELDVWDEEIVKESLIINKLRINYLARLAEQLDVIVNALLEMPGNLTLTYQAGTVAGKSMEESLRHQRGRDRETGATHSGPHRADIGFDYQGRDLLPVLSRGRQKLLVIALQLAQLRLIPMNTPASRLLLLDDLGAELDMDNQRRVFDELAATAAQVFVTAIQEDVWKTWVEPGQLGVFHVEHGKVGRVI